MSAHISAGIHGSLCVLCALRLAQRRECSTTVCTVGPNREWVFGVHGLNADSTRCTISRQGRVDVRFQGRGQRAKAVRLNGLDCKRGSTPLRRWCRTAPCSLHPTEISRGVLLAATATSTHPAAAGPRRHRRRDALAKYASFKDVPYLQGDTG